MTEVNLSVADAEQLIVDILVKHKTSQANAESVARALIAAEIDGQKGHGLSRVPFYAEQSAVNKVHGDAVPTVTATRNGSIRIDAGYGFAFPAFELAIDELIKSTPESGICAASIFNSHHFGQAGYHVEKLASHGLLAMVYGNSPKAIAPWGGSRGIFGTNPIGFAAPRRDASPLVVDLSLSKVARGKVIVANQKGEPIPEGWALDEQGNPTTDAAAALKGTMLPIGGAKGAALALMVELLAAGLTGGHFGHQASSFLSPDGPPPAVGQFIIAIDVGFFSDGSFLDRIEELIAEMLAEEGVRLPGSGKNQMRELAQTQGVNIPESLMQQLQGLKTA